LLELDWSQVNCVLAILRRKLAEQNEALKQKDQTINELQSQLEKVKAANNLLEEDKAQCDARPHEKF